MYIPYTSFVIGRIYNESVIQYWRSCTPSRSIGECAVPGLNAILCFLWFTNCILLFDKNLIQGCLWHLIFVYKQYFDTRYLVFYNTSPPRMFLSLDLLWEYRIQHGANVRKRWRATAWCGKSKFTISSGWLTNGSLCHPDDIITLS